MAGFFATIRELERFRQIYLVLVRHGFADVARRLRLSPKRAERPTGEGEGEREERNSGSDDPELLAVEAPDPKVSKGTSAERVRLVAIDLGPSFVKLGQIASTRTDLLPAEWVVELKKLQDEVEPLPYERIREAVEASLGAPLEQLYARFDERPLAAASIGQVHRAALQRPEGPLEVVVKVQRPGIRTTVASDLDLLHRLARLVESAIPESTTYSPTGLVDQFDQAITAELDFQLEAENAVRFRRNFSGDPTVRFPLPYREASSRQVLTLELLPGKKVYDAIAKDGFSGEKIAKIAIRAVMKMIFEDGFFHADPHPGNILISGTPEAPVIGFIDLGMVGRLSPEMRDRCIDLMVAAGRQDAAALADALYAIGTPTRRVEMRAFRAEVAVLSEKYLGRPLKEIELAGLISDLVMGARKFGLEIPPDFLLVGKALMTLEGVGKEIYPDLDVFSEVQPYFIGLLKRRYSPDRLATDALRALERLGATTYDLPQLAREVLEDARLGRLVVTTNDTLLPNALDRLGRRLFTAIVIAAILASGVWLVGRGFATTGTQLLVLGALVLVVHLLRDRRA